MRVDGLHNGIVLGGLVEITPEIQALLDEQKATLAAEFEESVKGLKANQAALLEEKQERQRAIDEAKAQAEKEALEKAAANKDVETLTASYEEKLKLKQEELDKILLDNKSKTKSQLASDFLTEYGVGSQLALDAMKSEYQQRIDIRDGKTVVLDPEGNLTALTIDDLNKEFLTNSRYADNIKGSNAAGGGANGNKGNGGGATKKPHEMNEAERAEFKKRDPVGFKQAFNLK